MTSEIPEECDVVKMKINSQNAFLKVSVLGKPFMHTNSGINGLFRTLLIVINAETIPLSSLKEQVSSLKVWEIDGWMTCNFISFLTVFQSYQDMVG